MATNGWVGAYARLISQSQADSYQSTEEEDEDEDDDLPYANEEENDLPSMNRAMVGSEASVSVE